MRKKTLKGEIRTKEHCLNCGGKFEHMRPKVRRFVKSIANPEIEREARVSKDARLMCPKCTTEPRRYFLDIYYKERLRIFSDQQGNPLDSWDRAMLLLNSIRNEIEQHTFDPTRYVAKELYNYLFDTRIEAWYNSKLKEVENGNLSKDYVQCLLKYFKDDHYIPFFKGMDIREIRGFHIREFYENLPTKSKKDPEKSISLKHIKNIMDGLRNFFNEQKALELILSVPSFPKITLDRKAPKWIGIEDQMGILKAIPIVDRPIFTFLAFQGVRPGEARALKVRDINFKDSTITISRTYSGSNLRDRVKSKVIRPRWVNPILVDLLHDACKNKTPDAFVFTCSKTNRPYSKSELHRIWTKARTDLKIDITLYQATRHSVASIAVSNGAPITAIKEILGHTDIRTTLIYAHTNLEAQKAVFQSQTQHGKIADIVGIRAPIGHQE